MWSDQATGSAVEVWIKPPIHDSRLRGDRGTVSGHAESVRFHETREIAETSSQLPTWHDRNSSQSSWDSRTDILTCDTFNLLSCDLLYVAMYS